LTSGLNSCYKDRIISDNFTFIRIIGRTAVLPKVVSVRFPGGIQYNTAAFPLVSKKPDRLQVEHAYDGKILEL